MKALAPGTTLAIVAWCSSGRAAGGDADLIGYYGGERTSAYVAGSFGVAAAAGGAVLVAHATEFSRALGWTWIAMGGLEAIGAVGYAIQVGSEIDHYEMRLAHDPAGYRAEEIDHIRGTTSRFVFYRITEASLVLGGGATAVYGWAAGKDTWKGIGIGIASVALPVAVIDTVNDSRAHRYLRALEAVSVAPTEHGIALSLGGHF